MEIYNKWTMSKQKEAEFHIEINRLSDWWNS